MVQTHRKRPVVFHEFYLFFRQTDSKLNLSHCLIFYLMTVLKFNCELRFARDTSR